MIINANSLDYLQELDDNSIDSVVTDPPYGLSFMGKKWDYDVPSAELWTEVFRVLKPGGYLLSFAGTRTQHRMAVNIEDAGFEIRDMIAWVYGSGFPKSHNIGKAVDKMGGNSQLTEEIGVAIKKAREVRGLSATDCDKKYCGGTTNWSWYEGRPSGQRCPDDETFERIASDWGELKPYAEKVKAVNREVIGQSKNKSGIGNAVNGHYTVGGTKAEYTDITAPSTEQAKKYEGWGTALKPSHEDITVAQKPIESRTDTEYNRDICQTLLAQTAKQISTLNLSEPSEGLSIAQWTAEKNINTLDDLSEAMAILQSYATENTNLNTVLSWLNILAENWLAKNMSTISMKLNTITELKILHSLEWESILKSIMLAESNQTSGWSVDVYNAISLLNALELKLKHTLEHSVDDNAMLKEKLKDLRPSLSPIVMARKPVVGTVAQNVLKWGTGGINIDGSRVETEDNLNGGTYSGNKREQEDGAWQNSDRKEGKGSGFRRGVGDFIQPQGRFPANLIHDGSDEVVGLFPDTKGDPRTQKLQRKTFAFGNESQDGLGTPNYNDSGSAARYFKTIERNEDGINNQTTMERARGRIGSGGEQDAVLPNDSQPREDNSQSKDRERGERPNVQSTIQGDRLIYTAKASKSERNKGLEGFEEKEWAFNTMGTQTDEAIKARGRNPENQNKLMKNNHPTVKPVKLMQYLVKLVTPKNGTVLDPFNGSGTTGIACKLEDFDYIGIELDPEYVKLSEARIEAWNKENTLV